MIASVNDSESELETNEHQVEKSERGKMIKSVNEAIHINDFLLMIVHNFQKLIFYGISKKRGRVNKSESVTKGK